MQGLILAAGESSRLRPLTLGIPKPLISICGKTLIDYSIEKIRELNVKEIGIVVGYLSKLIEEYISSKYSEKFEYILQERRLGIANAIYIAIEQGFIKDSFVTYLSDNIFIDSFENLVNDISNSDVFVLLSKVRDPSRFGVALIENNKIKKLVEKPKEFISNYVLTGLYYFRDPDLVLKAYRSLRPSERGEYEITELIQWFIDRNYDVKFKIVEKWWKDVGTRKSLLEATYFLLDNIQERYEDDNIEGRVRIEKGAKIEGKIIGPAYIGENVIIEKNVVIQPYTCIEKNNVIFSGKILFSLIQEGCFIDINNAKMIESVIGKNSKIISKQNSNEISLFLSSYSELFL